MPADIRHDGHPARRLFRPAIHFNPKSLKEILLSISPKTGLSRRAPIRIPPGIDGEGNRTGLRNPKWSEIY